MARSGAGLGGFCDGKQGEQDQPAAGGPGGQSAGGDGGAGGEGGERGERGREQPRHVPECVRHPGEWEGEEVALSQTRGENPGEQGGGGGGEETAGLPVRQLQQDRVEVSQRERERGL